MSINQNAIQSTYLNGKLEIEVFIKLQKSLKIAPMNVREVRTFITKTKFFKIKANKSQLRDKIKRDT